MTDDELRGLTGGGEWLEDPWGRAGLRWCTDSGFWTQWVLIGGEPYEELPRASDAPRRSGGKRRGERREQRRSAREERNAATHAASRAQSHTHASGKCAGV